MTPIHPGEHLAEELRELNLSAAAFSRQIGVPTNRITQILNGRRSITGDTALRLAHFFGTSAEFWLNLQSLYEIRLAQQKSGKAIKSLPTLKTFARNLAAAPTHPAPPSADIDPRAQLAPLSAVPDRLRALSFHLVNSINPSESQARLPHRESLSYSFFRT